MSTRRATLPLWTRRDGIRALVALHVISVVPTWSYVIWGFAPGMRRPNLALTILVSSVIGAIQLRHSLAAARGERPRGWRWTFLLIVALTYLTFPYFTWYWTDMQWFVIASAAMLLRGRVAILAVALPAIGHAAVVAPLARQAFGYGPTELAISTFLSTFGLATGAAAIYWAARLIYRTGELFESRVELAKVAVEGERRRISRDLHDLLGQSLSAVSLKGDLAIRLLPIDPDAALAEIESLTSVARNALKGVRTVAVTAQEVSLQAEIDSAAALLGAAGIEVRLDLDLPRPGPVEDLLAWAVREGVTNALRHSEARNCLMTVENRQGSVRLEIVNDGARALAGEGSGLAGLAERAQGLSGSVRTEQLTGGRFSLVVEAPEEAR